MRELEYEEYYWLDKTKRTSWRPGAFNEYTWPSKTVLRHTQMAMADLGAVVRLKQEESVNEEWVAPAGLYHASLPEESRYYRFTLMTTATARVGSRFYRDDELLISRPESREVAERPFTIRFETQGQPEGWYRLELSGRFEDNRPLTKVIRFYHRPGAS